MSREASNTIRGELVGDQLPVFHVAAPSIRQNRLRKSGIIVAPMVMPIYLLLIRGLVFDGWNGWYYTFQRTIAEMMLVLRPLEAKLRS